MQGKGLPNVSEMNGKSQLELLRGISGAFRPGILTCLMGVSGAGKTTLMDVLSGRKTGGHYHVTAPLACVCTGMHMIPVGTTALADILSANRLATLFFLGACMGKTIVRNLLSCIVPFQEHLHPPFSLPACAGSTQLKATWLS